MRVCCHLFVLWTCLTSSAFGHGINGHINVTAWATSYFIETHQMSEGCRNAILFGSAFPDSGYPVDHPYGELTHWPAFLNQMVGHIVREASDELEKCFTLGVGAHGLQDEIFDTFFLEQVAHHDQVGQDTVDPGLDAIMVADGWATEQPEIYLPKQTIIQVLAESFGVMADDATLERGAHILKSVVIDGFPAVAVGYATDARTRLKWSVRNYLRLWTVGSLGSAVDPTHAYMREMWRRLSGLTVSADIISTFFGREVMIDGAEPVYGIVLSRGVRVDSLAQGIEVTTDLHQVRRVPVSPGIWTQGDDDFTRVLRLTLPEDLSLTEVRIRPGPEWIWVDDQLSLLEWVFLKSRQDEQTDQVVPVAEVSPNEQATSNEYQSSEKGFGGHCSLSPLKPPCLWFFLVLLLGLTCRSREFGER